MSVLSFDPDPPRVASPWLSPEDHVEKTRPSPSISGEWKDTVQPGQLSDYSISKLQAEPHDGPTEYKFHLLLRPRRKYEFISTAVNRSMEMLSSSASTSRELASMTSPSRQTRLLHLTTQLLWRLQQSSPYHASSTKHGVFPELSGGNIDANRQYGPGKLPPGLEESRGALYEIGVLDDGTLSGLTKDEMDESVSTLKIMASSLGCKVEVLRMVLVGECSWIEPAESVDNSMATPAQATQSGKLWVAEALITPDLSLKGVQEGATDAAMHEGKTTRKMQKVYESSAVPRKGLSTTDQLRVSLTGPTTSGKSTLLGTLTTGTLDTGRGKSRLTLLRHPHEVESGMTSSVAQELIGYKDNDIFNYLHPNIESWSDIHELAQQGRMVFVSDSAGHPRYRRTILRGMVGWAPHWTVLCISADSADSSSSRDPTPSTAPDTSGAFMDPLDLAMAHLKLCLKMQAPLAVVVTKLDLASRDCLQSTIGGVLTSIKAMGRTPRLLHPDRAGHADLKHIPEREIQIVDRLVNAMASDGDLRAYVPIIPTSAVNGTGIGLIHALLQKLPLPPPPTSLDFIGNALNPEQPSCIFHVDDTFSIPVSYPPITVMEDHQRDSGIVVSGYLRFGHLTVGDRVLVGPFPAVDDDERGTPPDARPAPSGNGLSSGHASSVELSRMTLRNAVYASTIKGEWYHANICSIRNLRLPVLALEPGQVGTLGIVLEVPPGTSHVPRIRKGMVIAVPSSHMMDTDLSLQAASGLTVQFEDSRAASLTVGSLVSIYVATVRATAKIVQISLSQSSADQSAATIDEIDNLSLDQLEVAADLQEEPQGVDVLEVTLKLLTNREWIELGSQILVLEGGSRDKSGLEAFVGKVVEIVD